MSATPYDNLIGGTAGELGPSPGYVNLTQGMAAPEGSTPYDALLKPPSKGLDTAVITQRLHQMGLADDPTVKQMLAEHGAAATWDALHMRGPSAALVSAGQDAQLADTPWYDRALLAAGDAGSSAENALNNAGAWMLNKAGVLSDPAYAGIRAGNEHQQAGNDAVSASLGKQIPGYGIAKGAYTLLNQAPALALSPEVEAPTAATALGRVAQAVPQFAKQYVAGAGAGLMQQGSPGQNVAMGGAANTVIPGVLGLAGRALGPVAGYASHISEDLRGLLTDAGNRRIAGNTLRDVLPNGVPTIPDAYVPGFRPDLSMVTRDPKVAALRNALVGKTLDDPLIAQQGANNEASVAALNSMRPNEDPATASARAQAELQARFNASHAAKNAAFAGTLQQGGNPWLRFAPVRSTLDSVLGGLSPTQQLRVPQTLQALSGYTGNTIPAKHLLADYLAAGEDAQMARVGGDYTKANIAGDTAASIKRALLTPDVRTSTGAFMPSQIGKQYASNMQGAFDLAAQHHAVYSDNPTIASVISRSPTVGARVAASQALDHVLASGTPENVKALSDALAGSKDGRDAVLSWFTNRLHNEAVTQAEDTAGNQMASAARVRKMIDQADPLLQRFATPQQYGLLQKYKNSVLANNYPSAVKGMYGNSATAPLLNTGNAIFDRAYGALHPATAPLTEAGAATGAALGGPVGAVVGAHAGSAIDRTLAHTMKGRVNNITQLLVHAMSDPETARLLMRDARAPEAPSLIRRLGARLTPYQQLAAPIGRAALVHAAVANAPALAPLVGQ